MKRIALVLVLLLCASAQAVTYDTLGYSNTGALDRVTSGGADSTPAWNMVDNVDSNTVYTASTGDSVISVHVYGDNGDSTRVGIYKWVGSAPTDSVRTQLIVLSNGGLGWDSVVLSTKWALTNGTKYTYAVCPLNSVDYVINTAWTPSGENGHVQTGVNDFPATYSHNDFWSGIILAYFVIGKYGAGGGTVTVVVGGNNTSGGNTTQ